METLLLKYEITFVASSGSGVRATIPGLVAVAHSVVLSDKFELVVDINPSLMQNVFYLSQAQRKTDVIHHCQPDDLG